ncbi:Heme/hemopexin-binding protein precursor [compost metagenome]
MQRNTTATHNKQFFVSPSSSRTRLKPLAHAIALMLATGSMLGDAQAQQAFSAAWYAQKGAVQAAAAATGKLPNGMPAMPSSSPLQQQQQANTQLQSSLANLNSAARAIALAQAQQSAARLAATGTVPDGLGVGGLDAGSLVNSWINANGPTQSTSNGKTIVDIKQTADKAILNWETFNIGKNTILQFDQQADWSVLNRINNATAPSVIQGQIKAPGTVMIVNANGIVFTGSSQVNTRNLVAAAVGMSNDQFNKGIYSEKLGNNDIPTFGNAVSSTGVVTQANAFGVVVEQGALIETHQSTSATQGGGYVLMVGGQVNNAGTINTANGQTTLAAGDSFIIKKGAGTAGNQASTTRGNEVTAVRNIGSSNGTVLNTGIVTASTGDITLSGHQIEQRGVLVASTSVDTRGTIHLQGNPTDTTASITLGKDSVTAIVLDASTKTALDSQKNGLAGPAVDTTGNIVPVNDRRDLSRIEISGGTVDFEGESLTLATGGQVMVDAKSRALVRDGAQIDVSGAVGVQLGMDSNNFKINVQGNEQRDASVNRDGKGLNNSDIWVDKRDLILVKADYDAVKNPNGYKTDRWYTAGGLLEVAGYLATSGHSVGEWMAQGGIVNFTGNSVVTQAGSNINLSGGTLDVQTGLIKQTFLKGADGKLYNASTAPGDLLYTGVYKGFETDPSRWGDSAKKYYYNPLIAPRERLENGYTVGRDAGTLVIGTANAVLEGKISSDVYQGPQQTRAPQANLDGYYQSQTAVAQHAQLIVGSISNFYDKTTGLLSRRVDAGGIKNVVFSDADNQIADNLDLSTALPAERLNTLTFNTEQLNGFALGSIKIAATDKIDVNGDLKVNSAGSITLYSNNVNVNANLTAHSGTIQLGNVLDQITTNGVVGGLVSPGNPNGQVTLAQGVKVDVSGIWSNLQLDPNNTSNLPYINGGSVSIRSGQNVTLNTGSSIDVSSGAALLVKGKTQDGKGGNITLEANAFGGSNGVLALDGTLAGYGVAGGGTLTLQTNQILIGAGGNAAPDTLVLDGGFFNKGFSNYNIIGNQGLTVADGTQVDVTMPVYRFAQNATGTVGGSNISDALELWAPPVYQEDIVKGVMTQRKGASIKLQAGSTLSSSADMAIAQAVIGKGAVINVDPGQSITVASVGQLTVDGRLNAWGGKITLAGINPGIVAEAVEAAGHTRSIWVGEQAILDAAARAVTGVDARGNRYGQVRNGGSIVIGGEINHAIGNATAPNLFVVVREGAVLDASGTHATLDIAGQGATNVASGGGNISLTSNLGLYIDGTLKATSGGAGAAGGSLSVALEAPVYLRTAASHVLNPRELVIEQHKSTSALQGVENATQAGSILTYGHGRLAVDQVDAGGFDNLSVLVSGTLTWAGDVTLKTNQSLRIYGSYALADGAPTTSKVRLESSYIQLASNKAAFRDQYVTPRGSNAAARGIGAEFSAEADLIDIRGTVELNAERVELISRGDLRFLTISDGWDGIVPTTNLNSPGDIILKAAQLYPETGGGAAVKAGYRPIVGNVLGYDPRYSLTIGRTTDYLPAMPYSAFGTLQLLAAHVEQGGIVRAPLGYIALGAAGYDNDKTLSVNLLANSVTSVSGAGLVMPYGGTIDGQSWSYNGKEVTFTGVGGANSRGTLITGVKLAGIEVDVNQGAVLDLSGGGDLTGAAFISGRGGSTDARYNPLVQIGVNGGFSLPGLGTNPIYAIVPGAQGYAPANAQGAVDPVMGRQVTIGPGVPGLPAGTYTLMPSTYALLPGAFRVEINGAAGTGGFSATQAMRNGSWAVSGALSIAGTDIRDNLASRLIVTPANVLRSYSQYNETSYTAFALADAARRGIPRPIIPLDAKTLQLDLLAGAGADAFRFEGEGRFNAAPGGYGGTVSVVMTSGSSDIKNIEIVAAGAQATAGFNGITLHDDSLNNIGASRMVIGGMTSVAYGQSGNYVEFTNAAQEVHLRSGARLFAPEIFLTTVDPGNDMLGNGLINIEQGASISTLGRGKVAYDSNDGFVYKTTGHMLAASNGLLNVTQGAGSTSTRGGIKIGSCTLVPCVGATTLYSEGTVLASTQGGFELDDAVRYGTRNLTLAVGAINIGSEQALADAQTNGIRSSGLALNQSVLDRLLRGDASTGAPALETLVLNAANSVNFYGDVTLDTYDAATGKSTLDRLVLTTPAIYGQGDANTSATIRTANLIWGGAETAAGNVIANGAGTGSGTLNLITERMEFGFAPFTQPGTIKSYDRLVLGFGNVKINASERVTANHKGSLSVYQAQGTYESGKGFQYSGGNLIIMTPLLTGAAGSVNNIVAGGNINIVAPAGASVVDSKVANDALGAELSLHGNNVNVASKVVLPSGKLKLIAEEDLILTDAAQIDLAGRKINFLELDKYSWGGDVILESRNGDIVQAVGSTIDVSAANNKAGSLAVVALADAAGMVSLQGRILGGSSGYYDAGGTMVPYQAGSIEVRAQTLGNSGTLDSQFAALNTRLNEGNVFGGRNFQLKQGDLTIGNELKAGVINVSVDNGSLTVVGTIDASGERVGNIRLAGKNGMTIGSNAVLDAHSTVLRVDSYGKIIDSPNRANVELSSGNGTLTLATGAQIDLRHGTNAPVGNGKGQHDGATRGTLTLNAPRIGSTGGYDDADAAVYGDIAINASGSLAIRGAKSIAVNGMQRYDNAQLATVKDASGNDVLDANGKQILDLAANGRPYQVINQDYLDELHDDSTKFIDKAVLNGNLLNNKLAGLNNATYADALHLRPGVEIVSNAVTNPGGDMIVQGDLDLSKYRYDSLNHKSQTGVYGSGEVGMLTIRAAGNLDIFGSINDGFAPPPETQDDKGWILLPGRDFTGGDLVVPGVGVTLADGTAFPGGITLNYDLPIKGFSITGRLPIAATLNQDLTLPAGTVLAAAVRDAAGNILFAAGTKLSQSLTLHAGDKMDAGSVLAGNTSFGAVIWPKGLALPGVLGERSTLLLDGNKALAVGSLIPSGTDVKLLAGVDSIQLRPEIAGKSDKLWAVAQMLPEGSQSWSLRLVAGADTEAADSRVVSSRPSNGDLRLADSHYGMFGKALPSKDVFLWTQAGADLLAELGLGPVIVGEELTDESVALATDGAYTSFLQLCAENPDMCLKKESYKWTQEAADELGTPALAGQPVVFEFVRDEVGFGSIGEMCAAIPYWCASTSKTEYENVAGSTRFSVIRTGTGDLELLSAGNIRMDSLFGVYTAGTSSTATYANDPYNQPRGRNPAGTVLSDADGAREHLVDGGTGSIYRAWYPDQGGNLFIKAGGDLTGSQLTAATAINTRPNPKDGGYLTADTGNWLWRQGSGNVATGTQAQPTAWWINFGTYTGTVGIADQMVGFTGFGTLGGGNVDVQVAGNAGALAKLAGSAFDQTINVRSQGLVLAVGSTGRVAADGSMQLTGGGDLNVKVGGQLNPASESLSGTLNGALVNLRGHVDLTSAQVGSLRLIYGVNSTEHVPKESRAFDSFHATRGEALGGPALVPGDATISINTLGDQVIQEVIDPGRITIRNFSPFLNSAGVNGRGASWFTLWTDRTSLDMFSAGGNLTPYTQGMPSGGSISDDAIIYPAITRAVAASGSLFYGKGSKTYFADLIFYEPILLAPSINGQLQFLAADSIYAGGFTVSQSGTAASALATPQNPAYAGWITGTYPDAPVATNTSVMANPVTGGYFPLFAFGANSAATRLEGSSEPARFYAMNGDMVGVNSGRMMTYSDVNERYLPARRNGLTWYEGAQPVWMIAGRDIVNSGTSQAESESSPYGRNYISRGNLFVHHNASDVSVVSAGRDILYSSFNVAGPGTLEITAGRNILMEDRAAVTSIGAIVSGDTRSGANVVLQAGVGKGLDYLGFIQPYLDAANLAQTGIPLAGQSGKVAKVYEAELIQWLSDVYGFTGDAAAARAYYLALPEPQQRVFARDVYFAELREGGREYNDVNSSRYGSFLRSRNAIGALIPTIDADGKAIVYDGDIIMYRGTYSFTDPGNGTTVRTPRSGFVHTNFGGNIQMLTPGGQQVFGIEGEAPPSTSGVITQGRGDIQLYARDSILLGQSRIMTTFGGDILAWSDRGDINAGRGSKTTLVYTPPKREYDQWGNVRLSSNVPSTGAGIATLAPIPEVPAGDMDLLAPLGTIDAGEAGIRVSGNVNIFALQVVNAANIKVAGEATGIPMIAAVNVGALTNASSAASSAAAAAQDVMARDRNAARQNLPSIFTVRVLGFGNEEGSDEAGKSKAQGAGYNPQGVVQVLGAGDLNEVEMQALTQNERQSLKK